jgi:replicative DNA helicase
LEPFGGRSYLGDLTGSVTRAVPVRELAQQIHELARQRHARDGLMAAAAACEANPADWETIVAQVDAALSFDATADGGIVSLGDLAERLVDRFNEPLIGMSCSPIAALTRLVGPMQPGQLIVVAGRSGMGKTACAASLANGVARDGHGALFVSLEMNRDELAERMLADLCFDDAGFGVAYADIRDRSLSDWHLDQLCEARDRARELPLSVVDRGTVTISGLTMLVRRHARRMAARRQKLELVIVDYLQLLRSDGKARSAYEAVSEVSRGLKALAKDCGVVVLALAQLSRAVEDREDRRPRLSDLRDSGQIEQDADVVVLLMRAEPYLRQRLEQASPADRPDYERELDLAAGQIEFICAKRRNGAIGTAMGKFHAVFQAVR